VSCAKTAEPLEMQFGMMTCVVIGNMYYVGCRCPHRKGAVLGVSCKLKSTVRDRILGIG